MDKVILKQKTLDEFIDASIKYRTGSVSSEEYKTIVNFVILYFIQNNCAKELKRFIYDSIAGCVIAKDVFDDMILYWCGRSKEICFDEDLIDKDLFGFLVNLLMLYEMGESVAYDYYFGKVYDKIIDYDKIGNISEDELREYVRYAKVLSVFENINESALELRDVMLNYIYALWKFSDLRDDVLYKFWFGEWKNIDSRVAEYLGRGYSVPELFTKVNFNPVKSYNILKRDSVVVSVPRLLIGVKCDNGYFDVYDIAKIKKVGGISKWSDLLDYIKKYDDKFKFSGFDLVWMKMDDFKNKL